MSVKIEGIPDGWELVRVGKVENGEFFITGDGSIEQHDREKAFRMNKNYVIIRKIEKPARYRAFANAAEFLAHPLSGDFIDFGAGEFGKVQHCDSEGVWFLDDHESQFYKDALVELKFRDGTPFGVKVAE
jgi:hypothetical protein